MEEEDDDFYDPADVVPSNQAPANAHNAAPGEPQDGTDLEDEEAEVEDDDVRFQSLFFGNGSNHQ